MIPGAPLPVPGEESDSLLLDAIRDSVHRNGPLSFARFMELALYHPVGGYYAREADPVGPAEGRDFYTAPSRHPSFGALLATQVAECLERVGGVGHELVEFGPGGGDLMASLLPELRLRRDGIRSPLRIRLVEGNPHRVRAQRARLERAGCADGVEWIAPEDWMRDPAEHRGCFLANEILDALPVHRLVCRQGILREKFVGWSDGPVEVEGSVSRPELERTVLAQCPDPREGQEFEVGRAAGEWVGGLARRLLRGYMLLVDYGYLAPEIHSPRHHRGTLLAYFQHRTTEEYLERIGRQDLTAHVNFSSLLDAAAAAGMAARGPIPQGRFLLALGALDRWAGSGAVSGWEDYRDRKAMQDLFLPGGFGESHQVVILATPGLDLDLRGLRPPERWPLPAGEKDEPAADRSGDA